MNQQEKPVLQGSFSAAAVDNRPKWSDSPVIPAFVVVLILLPFVNKAFHIDDPLFIWTAQQIQKHPLDFYGFNVNWYIREKPMYDVTQNPPLASYYIAGIGCFFGYGEIPLHIGFILAAIAVAVGTFYLARHFCSNALAAALIAVVNPVFLVSATMVMCDVMMLAFWVWALFFWIRGIETRQHRFLLLAAIFSILCALTKYFGIALIPLVAVYAIFYKRRLSLWVFYGLLPIIALALYQWWTFSLYGKGLLSDAFAYPARFSVGTPQHMLDKVLISLAFTGGCFITVLFYSRRLWSQKTLFAGTVLTIVLVVLLYFFPGLKDADVQGRENFCGDLMVTMGLMIAAGVSLIGLALDELRKRRDSKTLLIFLWVTGTFVFAGFINWTINARSLLPMAPAVGIMIASRLERRGISSRFGWLAPLVPAVLIAIAVVWADYTQANSARTAAGAIHREFGSASSNIWFEGHWGFQFYMQAAGYKPLNFEAPKVSAGDLLIIAQNNTNVPFPPNDVANLKRTLEFMPCPWLTTMNDVCGAGFYSQQWGPVPFLFGRIPPEIYYVMEIKSVWGK
jgi:hypothetical protein